MKYNKLVIILRTCDKVNAVSGLPRIASKSEVVKRCFNSLLKSIQECKDSWELKVELVIVDDHSTEETVSYLKAHSPSGSQFNSLTTDTGNGASLAACYQIADTLTDNTLVFFIEDDYLLESTCISEMIYMHINVGPSINQPEIVTHPVDYPDRYDASKLYSSYIVLGFQQHWRTVQHTTGTLMLSVKAFKSFRASFGMFTQYGTVPGINEDNTINTVYKKIPCFSPIPSLGHHYQYNETLSPYLDHASMWDEHEEAPC